MPERALENKVAVITGATSGIGLATVKKFLQEGATVVFSGRRESLGESISSELGSSAHFIRTNVSVESEVAALISRTVKDFGRLDILFNNAGGPATPGDICDISASDFDQAVNLILKSVFFGMKYASPHLIKQKSGVIISNASVAAHLGGYATSHLYSALKAAVLQLSKSVALELAESNVRVNTVSPGAIATGIFGRGAGLDAEAADETTQKMQAALSKSQPIPRSGIPDDVASAVVFLASDSASFITGRDLVIDGGAIAGRPHGKVQAQRLAMKSFLSEKSD